MSASDDTGYGESPDTSDGPVAPGQDQVEDGDGVTLTTDTEAQREDPVMRPGNAAG